MICLGKPFEVSISLIHDICQRRSKYQYHLGPILEYMVQTFPGGTSSFFTTLMTMVEVSLQYSMMADIITDCLILNSNDYKFFTMFLECLCLIRNNNLVDVENAALKETFDLLRIGFAEVYLLLRQVLPSSAHQKFAKNVFEYAIETGREHIVELLLQDEYNNISAETALRSQQSPLYYSYIHQHVAVASVLIRYGATAATIFFKMIPSVSRIDPELVKPLFTAGATFDGDILENLIICGNTEIAGWIIRKQDTSLSKWMESDLFHRSMAKVNSIGASTIVQAITEIAVDVGHRSRDPDKFWDRLQTLLDTISELGYLQAVQKLLRCTSFSKDTLARAVMSGNQVLVRFLLDQGADPSRVTKFGSSPFAEAVRIGSVEIGRLLVQSGALRKIKTWSVRLSELEILRSAATSAGLVDLSQSLYLIAEDLRDDWYYYYGLMRAIKEDRTDTALDLIRRGAVVELEHLVEALSHKNIRVARAILDVGDITFVSHENSQRFLRKAAELGDYSLIEDLIEAGPTVAQSVIEYCETNGSERESDSPLTIAAKSGNTMMVKLLLDSDIDVNARWKTEYGDKGLETVPTMTPLEAAVFSGKSDLIRFLIARGADPNDSAALVRAVLVGKEELVELLLEEFGKRYPDGKKFYGSQALKCCVEHGSISMLKAIWRRADTTSLTPVSYDYGLGYSTPLASAIEKMQGTSLIEVERMLELGADPNGIVKLQIGMFFDFGRTALEVAIATKSLPMVQLLLRYGAKVNPSTIKGVRRTPLQEAAKKGALDVVQLLLDRGADVNAPAMRADGGTALQLAATKGYAEVVALLLRAGADVNAPPAKSMGRTALEGAAEYGRVEMVKLLLEAGVKIEDQDQRYFKHAIRLAEENEHHATLEILRSYQGPKTEPPRPMALFAGCEGWTIWVVETDDGFEPWKEEAPVDAEEQEQEGWKDVLETDEEREN